MNNNRNLTPSDYHYFEKNFCSREFVELFKIFRAADERAAEMLGRKRSAYTPWDSIAFPHYDIKTGEIVEFCLKPDDPETETKADGTKEPKYKYLFPPGRGNILYYPPNAEAGLLKDISKPLVITEGKKQLIALTRVATNDNLAAAGWHFLPVAINGVWGWRSKAADGGVIPQFNDITWQFRAVYLLFDADVETNWKVRYARQQLAAELQRRGAVVHLVSLPKQSADESKKGIDDVLANFETNHGTNAAIAKGLELILTDAQLFPGELQAAIGGGKLILGAAAAERGKCRLTAKTADGEAAAMDIFNPADAARRDKFVKQISDAVQLTSHEKREISAELINLAAAADSIFSAGPTEKTKTAQTEPVETSFRVLTDGRVVEQIRGGFAVYNPETNEHEKLDAVEDSDGTTCTPVSDALFSEGGLYIADDLTEYETEKELIADIEKYLLKYLDLQPLFLKLTALYILFTYIFDKFLELSYINATGDMGSGKSRFGLAMALASRRGLALITPSAASVFRIVDKFQPTMFLDEFNSADSDDAAAIIQILNAGFQRTGKIPRQVATGDGNFKTELFDPFCPKIIGSLKKSNSNAFNSRCIEIEMESTIRNDIPLSLSFQMLKDAGELRNKLTLYRLRNYHKDFETRRNRAETELKRTGISGRAIQVNCPLFALIESEEIKREFITLLKGREAVLAEEKGLSIDGQIIDKIHTLFFDTDDEEATILNAKNFTELPADGEVCEQLTVERLLGMMNANRPKEIDAGVFGKMIFGLGLKTKKIVKRSSEHRLKKAIVFDIERLGYLFRIYNLPVSKEFTVTTVTKNVKSNNINGLSVVTGVDLNNGQGFTCYQSKSSKEATYTNGNSGGSKNTVTPEKETKVLIDEVV
ncbi:MAG TPA: DUF3854 domain-containing protein [Pyrinomonadaceae bacterium]|nr:DUF3854 domain-containing protein [Pyrinomonadaceae bacterium]